MSYQNRSIRPIGPILSSGSSTFLACNKSVKNKISNITVPIKIVPPPQKQQQLQQQLQPDQSVQLGTKLSFTRIRTINPYIYF
jgi:hypothetical protein